MVDIDFKNIRENLLKLASIPSLSSTAGERKIEDELLKMIKDIDYFRENPRHIFTRNLPEDPHNRKVVACLLSGPASRQAKENSTVILLNHHDVVDIKDYGQYKKLAFSPEKLTRRLKRDREPEEGKNFLYGRGIADMKAGIAIQLAVLEHFSGRSFGGNILFISVPDEETSSRGMLEAIDLIYNLKDKFDLDLQAAINCEPTFPAYPGDEGRYIYTGSMGKSVIFFFCIGQATHAGDSLSGLNGNLLLAEIIRELEGNIDYCDTISSYTAPPPSCLKAKDFKRYYSAQIPHTAGGYFNINLLNSNPLKLMTEMKSLAENSLAEVLSRHHERRQKYFQSQGTPSPEYSGDEGWVLNYGDLLERAKKSQPQGSVEDAIQRIIDSNIENLEEQELCLKIVEHLVDFVECKGPGIVVGFTPPFYPPVVGGENSRSDGDVQLLAQKLKKIARHRGYPLKISPVFPGISDLSYCRLEDDPDSFQILADNLPLWEREYKLPLEKIYRLNLPVINISVEGYDAHKSSERLEINYSLKVVPKLVEEACKWFL